MTRVRSQALIESARRSGQGALSRRGIIAAVVTFMSGSWVVRGKQVDILDIWADIESIWRMRLLGAGFARNDPSEESESPSAGAFRSLVGNDLSLEEDLVRIGTFDSSKYRDALKRHGWSLQTLSALTRFSDFRPSEIAEHLPQALSRTQTGTQSEIVTRIELGVSDRFKNLRLIDFDPDLPFVFSLGAAYSNPLVFDKADEAHLVALVDEDAAYVARRIGVARSRQWPDLLKRWSRSSHPDLAFWARWASMLTGNNPGAFRAVATPEQTRERLYEGEAQAIVNALDLAGGFGRRAMLRKLVDGRQSERMIAAYALALSDLTAPFVDVYSPGPAQLERIKTLANICGESVDL